MDIEFIWKLAIPAIVILSIIAIGIIICVEEKQAHIKDDELEELNKDVSIYVDKQWLKDKQSKWNERSDARHHLKDKESEI